MPAARHPHTPVATASGHDASAVHAEDPTLARIGAFSDGVFAFAITLLILAIRIPHPSDGDAGLGLFKLLTQEWRSYLAFVLSFMIVGMNWANHRVMFKTFARANHGLVWLNLLYLMVGVAFIPVPTAVLGAWLGSSSHDDQVVAAVFYGSVGTVGVVVWRVRRQADIPLAQRTTAASPHRRLGAGPVCHGTAHAGRVHQPAAGSRRIRGDGLRVRAADSKACGSLAAAPPGAARQCRENGAVSPTLPGRDRAA